MKGDCNICANGKLPDMSRTCAECGLPRKNYKPMTNADRIRTMSDEELAEFIKADIIRSLVSLHISWISDFDAAVKEEWLARKRKEEGET